MTQNELKQKLYDLTRLYFGSTGGATVTWGKVKVVSPNVPHVVLNMGAVTRPYQPIRGSVNGILTDAYPSKTTLQVDLYTKGAPTSDAPRVTAAFENTAVNDLADFANFLNSAYVDEWTDLHDITALVHQINDLTEIINDSVWDYRAMVELDIGFTQHTAGYTALMFEGGFPLHPNGAPKYDSEGYDLDETGEKILDDEGSPIRLPLDEEGNPIPPVIETTPSGGRTQALADLSAGWFERVEGPHYERKEKQ